MNWEAIGPRVATWRTSIDDLVQQDVHSIYGVEAYQRALAEDGQEDASRTLRGVVTTRHDNLMADPALQGEWPQIAGGNAAFTADQARGEIVLQVTAQAGEGPTIEKMLLHHATGDLGGFSAVPMFDDGEHGDSEAGDGIFGATVTEVEPGRKVRFWVEAVTESGRVACQPSSGGAQPNVVRAPGKKKKKKKKQQQKK
ncbi:MAG: choice-of-anchor X domain-containing protein, partial [Planctomycetota bacterium]|nr:choice-of-anchor X domain-containing protein [Planctomycetota bacterium]